MSEDTCTNLLGALFERANVALDNIPGFNQLRSITSALAPLARRTGFSEKMFHHHHLFCSLMDPTSIHSMADCYVAIPHVDILPKLIQMLHKLITSEEPFLIGYKGLQGAAWLATYGSHVLGLNTCVVFPDAKEFPLLGSYEDARIILKLRESSSSCELHHTGDIQEYITYTPGVVWNSGRRWSIDCSKVNYIDTIYPGLIGSQSFVKLSRFVTMEALNASSQLSHAFLPPDGDVTEETSTIQAEDMVNFKNFTQSQLTEVHARCLRILEILEFLPGKLSSYVFTKSGNCEQYSCIGNKGDPESVGLVDGETLREDSDRDKNDSSIYNLPTSLVVEREGKPQPVLGRYFTSTQIGREDFPHAYRLKIYMNDYSRSDCSSVDYSDLERFGSSYDFRDNFIAWEYTLQADVGYTAQMAAHFALNLAWTDWDETVRLMNVDKISGRYGTLSQKASQFSKFEGNIAHAIGLCTQGLGAGYLEEKL